MSNKPYLPDNKLIEEAKRRVVKDYERVYKKFVKPLFDIKTNSNLPLEELIKLKSEITKTTNDKSFTERIHYQMFTDNFWNNVEDIEDDELNKVIDEYSKKIKNDYKEALIYLRRELQTCEKLIKEKEETNSKKNSSSLLNTKENGKKEYCNFLASKLVDKAFDKIFVKK